MTTIESPPETARNELIKKAALPQLEAMEGLYRVVVDTYAGRIAWERTAGEEGSSRTYEATAMIRNHVGTLVQMPVRFEVTSRGSHEQGSLYFGNDSTAWTEAQVCQLGMDCFNVKGYQP